MILVLSFLLICGCFWTIFCKRRQGIAHRNQSIQSRPHFYLNTTTQVHNYQQQAQIETSDPQNYQRRDIDWKVVNSDTIPQPDLSSSSLQKTPPPPYEATKTHFPPSSSPVFDSSPAQPSAPQFPLKNPSISPTDI